MDTPSIEVIKKIELLRKSIYDARTIYSEHLKSSTLPPQSTILLHSLSRSIELALGCTAAAIGSIPLVLAILNRALIEELITIQWILYSESNALNFQAHSESEALKYISINLERKNAKMLDKTTQNDLSKKFKKDVPYSKVSIPNIEKKAEEVGLHRLYTMLYTILSSYVHGTDSQFKNHQNDEDQIIAFIATTETIFVCILASVKHSLVSGRPMPIEEIRKQLNL